MFHKDLANLVSGQLVVVKWNHKDAWNRNWWLCKCSCGGEKVARADQLVKGMTKHCGCNRTKPVGRPKGTKNYNHLTAMMPILEAFIKRHVEVYLKAYLKELNETVRALENPPIAQREDEVGEASGQEDARVNVY